MAHRTKNEVFAFDLDVSIGRNKCLLIKTLRTIVYFHLFHVSRFTR